MDRSPVMFAAAVVALIVGARSAPAQPPEAIPARYRDVANRIIAAAQSDSAGAWNRIAELTDRFGHRLSGSTAREDAIMWTASKMTSDGLVPVRRGGVMVALGVRGAESLLYCPDLPKLQRLPIVKSADLQDKASAAMIFTPSGPGPGTH